MDDMKGFQFVSGKSGVEIKGYGFPLSLNEEREKNRQIYSLEWSALAV